MHRVGSIVLLISILVLTAISLPHQEATAATLDSRYINVSSASPSVTATHSYGFIYETPGLLGSIVFEYCDSPVFAYVCNAPAGLDVTTANLTSQTGNTGFSVDAADTTANRLVISRIPSAASAVTPTTYVFSNITNPSSGGQTVFVRISSHASTDGSGADIDHGAVGFATINPFNIGASVPPFLQICVGVTVAADCSSQSGDRIDLGTLVTSGPRAGQSQFSIGTNSATGYITYIFGTTMTSGNNVIPSLSAPTPSFPGNGQFGINLRANSNPGVGQEPSGSGTGVVASDYNTPNLFKFSSGDTLISSSLPTEYNRLTVSYLVNINQSQSPGIYASTYTYLAVANF